MCFCTIFCVLIEPCNYFSKSQRPTELFAFLAKQTYIVFLLQHKYVFKLHGSRPNGYCRINMFNRRDLAVLTIAQCIYLITMACEHVCRSRLSYEQFSAFLSNVKELNAHKQSREVFWLPQASSSCLTSFPLSTHWKTYFDCFPGNATKGWRDFWPWEQGSLYYIRGSDHP